jgi:hypothetical protein
MEVRSASCGTGVEGTLHSGVRQGEEVGQAGQLQHSQRWEQSKTVWYRAELCAHGWLKTDSHTPRDRGEGGRQLQGNARPC